MDHSSHQHPRGHDQRFVVNNHSFDGTTRAVMLHVDRHNAYPVGSPLELLCLVQNIFQSMYQWHYYEHQQEYRQASTYLIENESKHRRVFQLQSWQDIRVNDALGYESGMQLLVTNRVFRILHGFVQVS